MEKQTANGQVDQIREILFGPKIRELEQRIVKIEQQLQAEKQERVQDFRLTSQQVKDLAKNIDKDLFSLESSKTDHLELSALFADLSRKLGGEKQNGKANPKSS